MFISSPLPSAVYRTYLYAKKLQIKAWIARTFQGEFKGVFHSNIYFQMFLVRFESAFLGLMN